ncbi:MAG: riboflavin synthase [Bacteroidetes bacterium]|nr:riboflavin synthase [Bacteroidota bacterium]
MFTGIVEGLGKVIARQNEGSNVTFTLQCPFTHELRVDQSLSHNGVCLTVTATEGELYTVTAVQETLLRSNLGNLQPGHWVNLERCMPANGRFDGHIVQGHVDCTATLLSSEDLNGSWKLRFEHRAEAGVTVEKGSICVNGVSLTVVDSKPDQFSVVIIPYTWEHTNLGQLQAGDSVNIEFDIVGKYLEKYFKNNKP